jgi:hypothetical protein
MSSQIIVQKEIFLSEKAELIGALETTTSNCVKRLIDSRLAEIDAWLNLIESNVSDEDTLPSTAVFESVGIINSMIHKMVKMMVPSVEYYLQQQHLLPFDPFNHKLNKSSLQRMGIDAELIENAENEMKLQTVKIKNATLDIMMFDKNFIYSILEKKRVKKMFDNLLYEIIIEIKLKKLNKMLVSKEW